MSKNTCLFALVIAATALLSGCKKYAIEPPVGFVEVSSNSYETRMKAQDDVGLRVHRFANVRGGSLGYWAADLVTKLGKRGYVLTGQQPARSKNGREGTRFDFDYAIPGSDEPKFYTVVLFVTDDYKFTLELAGDRQHAATHRARIAEIAGELKIRGCKPASKICRSPQPPKLSSPPPDPLPGLPEPVVPTTQPAGPPAPPQGP
ncbi:hypothetical protein [Nannocystis bainbridge]|uniref:Lipoprotein n=1 Tax=Nannocystis bainbridge TaxID=2995303 RepID=A0ABT5DV69_9BACT|nr:hypothetical protein [Nannocystis bainbridge]MDC0717480.1 hypothetical protein [Nannocystis bainbridge]